MSMVLKIFSYQQVHRVLLAPEPDFMAVAGAVCALWPDAGELTLKFADVRGAAQSLTQESFDQFLSSATSPMPPARPMLKLFVASDDASLHELMKSQAATRSLAAPSPAAAGRRRLKSKLAAAAPPRHGNRMIATWTTCSRRSGLRSRRLPQPSVPRAR
eukprot:SRR837773.7760.p1 GENE.SRR837773.7760~~SRR837773.7760.p1  ORF type:complete len:159 (+),score=16.98 SRR837773.7760:81-557(+)